MSRVAGPQASLPTGAAAARSCAPLSLSRAPLADTCRPWVPWAAHAWALTSPQQEAATTPPTPLPCRHFHLNQLVRVDGVVTRRTGVFPQQEVVFFDCHRCGTLLGPFVQNDSKEIKLKNCPECLSKGPFTVSDLTHGNTLCALLG